MAATEMRRLLKAVSKTPWAILPEKGEAILDLIEFRASGGRFSDEELKARGFGENRERFVQNSGGVAILPLFGTISHRMNQLSRFSGGTSTERFGASFDEAIANESISTIVLDVDSPGGSVEGVEELAAKIFEARGKKRMVAIANSLMASAAYWIASAADEVLVTPTGRIGSIGVLTLHTELSKLEAEAGITRTIVQAGRFKAEGNPFEPLDDEARAHMQQTVDDFYGLFTDAVARHRGVNPGAVRGGFGEGRVLPARRAVAEGLADRIQTLEGLLEELGVGRDRQTAGLQSSASAEEVDEGRSSVVFLPGEDTGSSWTAEQEDSPTGADGDATAETEQSPGTEAPAAKEDTVEHIDTAPQNGAEAPKPVVTAGVDREDERERAGLIAEICEMHGLVSRVSEFIRSDGSIREIGAQIRAEAETQLKAMTTPAIELSEPESRRYSICRAIMADVEDDWSAAGFEKEVNDEIKKNLPKDYKSRGGIFVPTRGFGAGPVPTSGRRLGALRSMVLHSPMDAGTKMRMVSEIQRMQAALDSGTATAGQEIVFTEAGDFIDLLRARMRVVQLGATVLTGLQGPVAFPKQTGAGSFSWVAEDPGSDLADSDMTLGQVPLDPRTGQSTTAYSRQLLNQGVIDVDNLVQNDLALITALGIDLAAIAGSGAGNEPTGVLNTAGIGDVPIGANGGAPTYEHTVDLETEVATDNADIGTMAYLSTPGVRGKLKKTEEFPTSNGRPVWTGGMTGEVNGYAATVSTQVPADLTKGTGTNLHAIIFGVWSQLMIGHWGAYELVVDPFTKKKQALIELTSFQMAGIAVRHPESFAAVQDADIT